MLYENTVESGTLDILKKIMQLPAFQDFYLVGGTNLSLRHGHRKSDDIDLFSLVDFENIDIAAALQEVFPNYLPNNLNNPIGVFGYIDNLKVDIVKNHFFKQIGQPININGIKMFDDKDILAMKIFAILKRGVKKDFWDIAELLQYYSVKDCVEFYNQKYPNLHVLIGIPQAIIYFDDAEQTQDPISLKGQTWESVKDFIRLKVREYLA